jgi:GntR family transcriptional regulator
MTAGKVDRDSGVPPWRQVAADLRRRIAGGEWTSRLPSQRDLGYEYEVNFKVIRKALDALKEEGLIVTEQGYGSFVAGRGGSC